MSPQTDRVTHPACQHRITNPARQHRITNPAHQHRVTHLERPHRVTHPARQHCVNTESLTQHITTNLKIRLHIRAGQAFKKVDIHTHRQTPLAAVSPSPGLNYSFHL